MLKITFRNSAETIAAMRAKGPQIVSVIMSKLNVLAFQLSTKVVGKLSGEVLTPRSGKLRGSVTTIPAHIESGGKIIAGVESSSSMAAHIPIRS